MRMEEWTKLKTALRSSTDVSRIATTSYDYTYETLFGIFQQLNICQMMRTSYLVKTHGETFVNRFKAGSSLLDIAKWINLSPTSVARRVMELLYKMNRKAIMSAMRDTRQIADIRLRKELEICLDCDEYSGPRMNRIRSIIGVEYELRLIEEVQALELQYESEKDLRDRGCHKTPDILLRVPVAFCGKVVCWVDSKAKFGDEYTLRKDYADSISSYVGRFGPGMVVYWFGFIEDSLSPMLNDVGLLVVDNIPTDVQMLPGSCVPASSSNSASYTLVEQPHDVNSKTKQN